MKTPKRGFNATECWEMEIDALWSTASPYGMIALDKIEDLAYTNINY